MNQESVKLLNNSAPSNLDKIKQRKSYELFVEWDNYLNNMGIAKLERTYILEKLYWTIDGRMGWKTESNAFYAWESMMAVCEWGPYQPVPKQPKVYYCIDCNRPIRHKGRCMLCNMTWKKRLEDG